jgi:hypothetical protein
MGAVRGTGVEPTQAEPSPPECIRYRLTPLQRVLPLLPATVVGVVFPALMWMDGESSTGDLVEMLGPWSATP